MSESSAKLRTYTHLLSDLKARAREDKAQFLPGFFKAFPGGYGEGDQFLGVVVPDQRAIAKQYADISVAELKKILASPWHECRLTGVFILVNAYQRAAKTQNNRTGKAKPTDLSGLSQQAVADFYLDNLDAINNWDLVDSSAGKILGDWLRDKPKQRKILFRMAKKKNLWVQRIAVIATMPLIHDGQFDEFLRIANQLLLHEHDLMHKAIGWMLREMGKKDLGVLRGFLQEHSETMPRTMLRYAIEKLSPAERKKWLGK